MNKLVEILKTSTLSTTMSDMEIEEIVDEIRSDFEDYLEEEKEQIREDLQEEVNDKEKEIKDLKSKNEKLSEQILGGSSLKSELTREWTKENWEWLEKFQALNLTGKEIYNQFKNKKTSQEISDFIDNELKIGALKIEHKRIVLVGKAASGKDHARKLLTDRGYKYAVSYTTRPSRSNEIHGEDYLFITNDEFDKMIDHEKFYEHVTFNGWHYGTTNQQFNSDDIFIMTPHGISKIRPNDRKTCFIIYFDIEESIRKERLSKRSDADTVDRRLIADAQDFENFSDFDLRITNPNF